MLIDIVDRRLILTRLVNELQNGCGRDLTRAFPDNFEQGAVFALLLREGVAHLEPDPRRSASISVSGVAAALDRSYETTRRYVGALARRGLVIVTPTGLQLGPALRTDPAISRLMPAIAARFRFFVVELATAGLWSPGESEAPPHAGETVICALDLYLSALEFNGKEFGGWTKLLIVGAVLNLNVAHIMRDKALTEQYGNVAHPPPTDARIPASLRDVADLCGLPEETVRRHLRQLVAGGALVQIGRGVVLNPLFLSTESVRANAAQVLSYVRRVMGDLARGRYRQMGISIDVLSTASP